MAIILEKLRESKKPMLVGLAGPGTGKTTAFKTVVDADEFKGKKILILTFIRKLVRDLAKDFEKYENVTVSTLHSFAKKQSGDVDLDGTLDELINEDHLFLKGASIKYEEKFYEGNLSIEEEAFYEQRTSFYKYDKDLYSFSSIIYSANKHFSRNEDNVPSDLDLILIDEFQDFNHCEYEFIKWLNKKTRIVIVGDENQSLYKFKNAQPKLIVDLYRDDSTEEFSLDYCYRCTEVVIGAANDLIDKAKQEGFLQGGLIKKFLYPADSKRQGASKAHQYIDFIPAINGDRLIYQLEARINQHAAIEPEAKKRFLIIAPSYLKQSLYEGLTKKKFNVIEFELFAEEQCNKIKHKDLIEAFTKLNLRTTDNLALRKILPLYLSEEDRKELINKTKRKKTLWNSLSVEVKDEVQSDINLFKKVKKGEDKLTDVELRRFSKIFNIKNILSKMIKGFPATEEDAIEVEITTPTSSKGLTADFVYYIGIDDKDLIDREEKKFTDRSICEFLVGITRPREKLTLISLQDVNPRILQYLKPERIHRVEVS